MKTSNFFFFLFFTFLFLFSCTQNKKYQYVEIIKEISISDQYEMVEKMHQTIFALNDSMAYIAAFKLFCKSLEVNRRAKEQIDEWYREPENFRLINDLGDDIRHSVSFQDKREIEMELINRICPNVILPAGLKNISNDKQAAVSNLNTIIEIGNQVWMTENLNVTHFRNGDIIPEVRSNLEWEMSGQSRQPAWSHNPNNKGSDERYGKLYNWYAVSDPRGLAPEGWKIPSDTDWNKLVEFLGGPEVAGKKFKATTDWSGATKETNESGFTALPGGFRDRDGYFYTQAPYYGNWWSSTEKDQDHAWSRTIKFNNDKVERFNEALKSTGFSVRCIKD